MIKTVVWVCDVEGWAFVNQAKGLAKCLIEYNHKIIVLKYDYDNDRFVYDDKDKEDIRKANIVVIMTPSILTYTNNRLKDDMFIQKRSKVLTRLSGLRSV